MDVKIKTFILVMMLFLLIAPVSAKENETSTVIDETENFVIIETVLEAVNVSDRNPFAQSKMWFGYSIKNIIKTDQITDYNLVIRSSTLAPGGGHTVDIIYAFNTTIYDVLSISSDAFNIKSSMSSFPSVTLANSYSYSCPHIYKEKEVTSCTVTYYPRFQNYSFDEYFLGIHSGSGTAKVLTGFTQIIQIKTK